MATQKFGFRGKVLLAAALGFGGLLFVGRYLVMALMYVAQRLDLPTVVIAGLDFAYLHPLGVLFAQPGVYWGFSGLSLLLIAAALIGGRPGWTATATLVTVALIVVRSAVFLRYQPAVEAHPGVSVRVPTLPEGMSSKRLSTTLHVVGAFLLGVLSTALLLVWLCPTAGPPRAIRRDTGRSTTSTR